MPGPDAPVADLGSRLLALLATSLLWAALAAFVTGAICALPAVRHRAAFQRGRDLLTGQHPLRRREPQGRQFLRISFGLLWLVDGLLQAQPKMPGGFVADVLSPAAADAPGWFGAVVGPFARAWTRHPVAADAATVYVQVGIGLLLLIGGRGWLSKLALWGSLLWSAAIWVVGEAFGGLLSTGASFLSGAPGAALVYAAAAGLLLAPWEWWDCARAALIARRVTSGWLLFGAMFQALPVEKAWTGAGSSAPFVAGARMAQPALTRKPIVWLADLAGAHPAAVNLTIIVLLLLVACALWRSGRTAVTAAALVLCGATWWLGQDFGVLGGTSTDPNSALPLGLLLACSLPTWSPAAASPAGAMAEPLVAQPIRQESHGLRTGVGAGVAALGAALALVVPIALAGTVAGPADAAAVAADSNGGVRAVPARSAVPFTLTDQRNQPVSMSRLRGKLVVLTFLDPVCTSDCPLVANQLAIADRSLGSLAQQVEFVAIDTNPVFHLVSDVDAFTQSHGLGSLANWHFLCGSPADLGNVLAAYGISVDVPAVGMIQHTEGMYFVGRDGRQAAYLDDGAGEQLTQTYAVQVGDEIRTLLR